MWVAAPLLLVAIAIEVAATAALPRTEGFHQPLWTALVLGGYAISIWLLAVIVKYMDVSTVYAIWAGLGTAAIAVVGVVLLGEPLTSMKVVAIALIVLGVVLLNLQGTH